MTMPPSTGLLDDQTREPGRHKQLSISDRHMSTTGTNGRFFKGVSPSEVKKSIQQRIEVK
jgi:hypothetical protein